MRIDEAIKRLNLMLEQGQDMNNEAIKAGVMALAEIQHGEKKRQKWIPCGLRKGPDDPYEVVAVKVEIEPDVFCIELAYYDSSAKRPHWQKKSTLERLRNVRAWVPLPEL